MQWEPTVRLTKKQRLQSQRKFTMPFDATYNRPRRYWKSKLYHRAVKETIGDDLSENDANYEGHLASEAAGSAWDGSTVDNKADIS